MFIFRVTHLGASSLGSLPHFRKTKTVLGLRTFKRTQVFGCGVGVRVSKDGRTDTS